MPAFATDQTVSERDLETLKAAVQGDRQALLGICQRYKIAVLAVAVRSCDDLERAYGCVEPVLDSLCRQLLAARFRPDQWADRLMTCVAERVRMVVVGGGDVDPPSQLALSGLASIPRICRRRTVHAALPKLSLPELTAVLLHYVDHRSPSEMVGLVADSEHAVCQRLVAAHESLLQAVQAHQFTT